jgi:hypothetical protein
MEDTGRGVEESGEGERDTEKGEGSKKEKDRVMRGSYRWVAGTEYVI